MTLTARAVLKANLLLGNLPEPAIDKLAALAIRGSYRSGTRIFAQGEPGDALYGLIAGQVRISASTPGGQEVFLNILEPGDSFGEIAALDGHPRTASADALTDTELFLIRRADLLALIAKEPQLALPLLELLCKRLRWTSDLIEEAAFLSVPARLARRLMRLAEEHGKRVDGLVTLRLTQADLASFMNVSRQIVNQHLQQWRERGWIDLARGRVVIRNADALRGVVDARD
ncbi:MAG: Crp/Fnr family transcriptional regulator [Gammaproteobacteria bacterium]|nr:Crp/Fnr family transcriptional regulator [Gammaproteobacteria bacterium]